MPNLLPASSFKTTAAVVISGVLSVAAAVIFTVPSVSHFVMSCFPIIYDKTVFLLTPPYLYLVINCIIVSIVATSKLTRKSYSVDDSDFSEVVTPVTVVPVPSDLDTGYLNVVHVASDFTGFLENAAPVDRTVEDVQKLSEIIADDKLRVGDGVDQEKEREKPKQSSDSPSEAEQKKIIKPKNVSPEIEKLKHTKKPPRMSKQKSLKNSPEGGGNKKTALGVTKPARRQDTLETTWKKITEGRSTPLTKHLTKSDTWQERTHVQSSSASRRAKENKEKMTKSDNLNDINTPKEETRLKRDPSPGQEELNRRVEAFIKKFNEEMRLQRLESLAKYNELVNGGTAL